MTATVRFASSVLFLTIGLVACGTKSVPASRAKAAPPERAVAFQTKPAGASSTLVVVRDGGFRGGRCYYNVLIDGATVARLDAGEKSVLFVPPGEILLGAVRESGGTDQCTPGQGERAERQISLRENETQSFRVFIDLVGRMNIQKASQ